MSKKRKNKKTFKFYVEGDCEKLYLKWLQKAINDSTTNEDYQLDFYIRVSQNVETAKKMIRGLQELPAYMIFDYEGQHNKQKIKEILEKAGKEHIVCLMSHLTFETWILLHKGDFNKELLDQKNYLEYINKEYNMTFESLDAYKKEDNFQKLLSTLTLNDVISAMKRAKLLQENNDENQKEIITKGNEINYYDGCGTLMYLVIDKLKKFI